MACSAEEIRDEVWRQLTDAIDDGSLDKANVHSWFLDPAINPPNPTTATNLEPLLINTKGSWADRPDAVTRIPNFFLAADFVRTYTDLATMEAANEAARRAVNGILDATGSNARRVAKSGTCGNRWRWRRSGCWTGCAGSWAAPRPLRRCR